VFASTTAAHRLGGHVCKSAVAQAEHRNLVMIATLEHEEPTIDPKGVFDFPQVTVPYREISAP
jgi:hypothetical protein